MLNTTRNRLMALTYVLCFIGFKALQETLVVPFMSKFTIVSIEMIPTSDFDNNNQDTRNIF